METGSRAGCGVCAAVDGHYLRTGGARAAAVLAADAAFAHVLAERTAVVPRVAPYRPGEFHLRELPPLRAVLDDLSGLGLLVVDGYADLDPGGRPGLGAHVHAEFGIPVIGVAKSRFHTATHAVPVARDPRDARCSPRRPGCPALRRRTWSGAWPAGTGCPTHYAAPIPSRGQVRRSHNDRPPARLIYADARNAA
jgi:deoxyribonuclease V